MTDLRTTLPGGVLDESGTRHRDAVIRPLTGHEEEMLASASAPSAVLVTRVLARCTLKVGSLDATERLIRDLPVGDRQALLLAVRQATFGPRVAAVVVCPWRDCAQRMDIDFAIPDIPVVEADELSVEHRVVVGGQTPDDPAAPGREVRFRLPTGADQEAIGELALADPLAAMDALLQRCVLEDSAGMAPREKADVEQAMRDATFGPQLSLDAMCAECGRAFTLAFDIQDFFFGEVVATPDLLLREVHHLALHYHWAERDILGMPRDRRQRYLSILADEMSRQADAVV